MCLQVLATAAPTTPTTTGNSPPPAPRDAYQLRNSGLALAAYNAGLFAVQRYGDVPPFAETQGYVTAVMAKLVSLAAPPPDQLDGQPPAGEGCTIDDPTSGGCLTPRAYALLQHMVNDLGIPISKITCWDKHAWNPSSLHSRGRACDIMLTPGRWATGADRAYGDALVAHLTANSDALSLGTVIWYAQSWSSWRGTWRAYGGGGVYDVEQRHRRARGPRARKCPVTPSRALDHQLWCADQF